MIYENFDFDNIFLVLNSEPKKSINGKGFHIKINIFKINAIIILSFI